MKIFLAGNVTHTIKVTRLEKCWGVRCFTNGTLNQEIQVQCQQDISVASAEMLRTEDKCGNHSDMATASVNASIKAQNGASIFAHQKPSTSIT